MRSKVLARIVLLTFLFLQMLVIFQNCKFESSQTPPAQSVSLATHIEPTAIQASTSTTPPNRLYNVMTFGAKGDGLTIDRAAIQEAIDQAASAGGGVVYFPPGVYLVDVVTSSDGGIISLLLRAGVTLKGDSQHSSIIRLKGGAYGPGAFYRLVASEHNGKSSHMAIQELTIDGNSSQQATGGKQASNILLEADGSEDIVIDHVRSINSGGQGIQIRGTGTQYGKNIRITDNLSQNHSGICIQASQFDGLIIKGNISRTCGDNGIDVYGDNGTVYTHAKNFTIEGNVIENALVGIFNETLSDGVVSANSIADTAIGITVNRIHGEPKNISIQGNQISTVHNTGIRVTGDTGGIFISTNSISQFQNSAIELNNTANVTVTNNHMIVAVATTPLILLSGPHVYFSSVKGVESSRYPVSIDPSKIVVITTTQSYQNTISP